MQIQRLRNLTTARLHTEMSHIYQDLEYITGESGIMTHMIPRVMRAVEPWLRKTVSEPRFWDQEYDTTHVGEYDLPEPTEQEREEMFKLFAEQPNPLLGKETIVVHS